VLVAFMLAVLGTACFAGFTALARARDIGSALELQRDRVNRLDARVVELASEPPPTLAADTAARLDQCEAKLSDLRNVMDVLVRESQFRGRVRLPRPVSDWPAWSKPGVTYVWVPGRNSWPVTKAEAAGIRARNAQGARSGQETSSPLPARGRPRTARDGQEDARSERGKNTTEGR
jgi:hypothetical protein